MGVVGRSTRTTDEARNRWRRAAIDIGNELRVARLMSGASLRVLGARIDVSPSELSRRERARAPGFSGEALAIHAAAVGLRLSIKLWPVGGAVRDAAQARYIAAFVARVGRTWKVELEAPVETAGDLRAVDVLLVRGPLRVAVEVITRLADLQAQLRAAQLKARDIGATRLVIVAASTHANRRVVAESRGAVVAGFDLDTKRVLLDLAAGRDPGRDAIVVLTA